MMQDLACDSLWGSQINSIQKLKYKCFLMPFDVLGPTIDSPYRRYLLRKKAVLWHHNHVLLHHNHGNNFVCDQSHTARNWKDWSRTQLRYSAEKTLLLQTSCLASCDSCLAVNGGMLWNLGLSQSKRIVFSKLMQMFINFTVSFVSFFIL